MVLPWNWNELITSLSNGSFQGLRRHVLILEESRQIHDSDLSRTLSGGSTLKNRLIIPLIQKDALFSTNTFSSIEEVFGISFQNWFDWNAVLYYYISVTKKFRDESIALQQLHSILAIALYFHFYYHKNTASSAAWILWKKISQRSDIPVDIITMEGSGFRIHHNGIKDISATFTSIDMCMNYTLEIMRCIPIIISLLSPSSSLFHNKEVITQIIVQSFHHISDWTSHNSQNTLRDACLFFNLTVLSRFASDLPLSWLDNDMLWSALILGTSRDAMNLARLFTTQDTIQNALENISTLCLWWRLKSLGLKDFSSQKDRFRQLACISYTFSLSPSTWQLQLIHYTLFNSLETVKSSKDTLKIPLQHLDEADKALDFILANAKENSRGAIDIMTFTKCLISQICLESPRHVQVFIRFLSKCTLATVLAVRPKSVWHQILFWKGTEAYRDVLMSFVTVPSASPTNTIFACIGMLQNSDISLKMSAKKDLLRLGLLESKKMNPGWQKCMSLAYLSDISVSHNLDPNLTATMIRSDPRVFVSLHALCDGPWSIFPSRACWTKITHLTDRQDSNAALDLQRELETHVRNGLGSVLGIAAAFIGRCMSFDDPLLWSFLEKVDMELEFIHDKRFSLKSLNEADSGVNDLKKAIGEYVKKLFLFVLVLAGGLSSAITSATRGEARLRLTERARRMLQTTLFYLHHVSLDYDATSLGYYNTVLSTLVREAMADEIAESFLISVFKKIIPNAETQSQVLDAHYVLKLTRELLLRLSPHFITESLQPVLSRFWSLDVSELSAHNQVLQDLAHSLTLEVIESNLFIGHIDRFESFLLPYVDFVLKSSSKVIDDELFQISLNGVFKVLFSIEHLKDASWDIKFEFARYRNSIGISLIEMMLGYVQSCSLGRDVKEYVKVIISQLSCIPLARLTWLCGIVEQQLLLSKRTANNMELLHFLCDVVTSESAVDYTRRLALLNWYLRLSHRSESIGFSKL